MEMNKKKKKKTTSKIKELNWGFSMQLKFRFLFHLLSFKEIKHTNPMKSILNPIYYFRCQSSIFRTGRVSILKNATLENTLTKWMNNDVAEPYWKEIIESSIGFFYYSTHHINLECVNGSVFAWIFPITFPINFFSLHRTANEEWIEINRKLITRWSTSFHFSFIIVASVFFDEIIECTSRFCLCL